MSTPSGFKVLLMGGSGTGKTYATASLARLGLSVRCIWMEDCFTSLARFYGDKGEPIPDNIHWINVPLVQTSFSEMIAMAKSINMLSFQGLANVTDANRQKRDEFIKVLGHLADYTCERTGKNFGPVDAWGTDAVLVFESFTALSSASMALVVGAKPLRSQGEWGVAMDNLETFVNKITGLKTHVVLTGHIERETDENFGGTKMMVSTLGKKLAPKIPRYFSDVINARRERDKFTWATDTNEMDLKCRHLPIAAGQTPTFELLYSKWKEMADLSQPLASPTAKG